MSSSALNFSGHGGAFISACTLWCECSEGALAFFSLRRWRPQPPLRGLDLSLRRALGLFCLLAWRRPCGFRTATWCRSRSGQCLCLSHLRDLRLESFQLQQRVQDPSPKEPAIPKECFHGVPLTGSNLRPSAAEEAREVGAGAGSKGTPENCV